MQSLGGRVVYSASDLVGFLACEHLTQLDLKVISGELGKPPRVDASEQVVEKRGIAHEKAYLERLRAEGRKIAEISVEGGSVEGLLKAEADTIAAMRAGAEVVYQATFFDGRFRGHADFLLRVDTPSLLGGWSYEVADTKLARTVKARALLQMCAYAEQVQRVQGTACERIHVVAGDLAVHAFRLADFAAYYRATKGRFLEAIAGPPRATYGNRCDHCGFCRWNDHCVAVRAHDDHLSLVAGMRRDQVKRLNAAGIATVEALGRSERGGKVDGIGQPTVEKLREQARMQLIQRADGEVHHELLPVEDGRGLCLLPAPDAWDVFFDMEGDPLVEGGLEYLFGFVTIDAGTPEFGAFWAHSRAEEKRAFESFVDFVTARRRAHPGLHVFHYAAYEVTALKRLAQVHDTRVDEVDDLLRGGVFVDLFQVVRQGVRISQDSYSIKKLEPLYMAKRGGEVKDAVSSIVAYEQWLETRDDAILRDIEAYNRVDCESTHLLREWLEAQRLAVGRELPRKPAGTVQSDDAKKAFAELDALQARLLAGLPEERSNAQQAQWLLAQLLEWHRREAKPEWWAFFDRCAMTDEALFEDSEAISGLVETGSRAEKKSLIRTFRFDPAQEYKLRAGSNVVNPRTGKASGTIVSIDGERGVLELKLGKDLPVPTALIPTGPISSKTLEEALRRVGAWVAENGIEADGRFRAVRDLLSRRLPRVAGVVPGTALVNPGEPLLGACVRIAKSLENSYLPLQGPPGAGKTFTAGRMAVALVKAGKRVGVTANSHKVIGNLLAEICHVAAEEGVSLRALQKAEDGDAFSHACVEVTNDNDDFEARKAEFQVVAGTAWLFSRENMEEFVDVLFVDEAGQLSLANAVAVGTAAKNLVLLGDPQQLAQPQKGIHPAGAEASALGHLLAGKATISPETGVFLATTYRMHPEVTAFVSEVSYEGRLRSEANCANQRVTSANAFLDGAGPRWIGVPHTGNRSTAPEEIDAVSSLFPALLASSWTDKDGVTRPLGLQDVLVVSPYNAQVAKLRDRLPAGARVGTVDKFQGQEAPVTIYSMATSSAEEVPRTLEFLYELNRLNVAVSRAKGLAILVCSPDLLKARCRKPEQMRLVNALCRFVESARPFTA